MGLEDLALSDLAPPIQITNRCTSSRIETSKLKRLTRLIGIAAGENKSLPARQVLASDATLCSLEKPDIASRLRCVNDNSKTDPTQA